MIAVAGLLAGCAAVPSTPDGFRYTTIAPFSAGEPGEKLPAGWQPWSLSRFKRKTEYHLVRDVDGTVVVRAVADGAASGIIRQVDIDTRATPWLSWRWRVPTIISGADNTDRSREDSPARVVVAFEGDPGKLDFEEKAIAARVKALTGSEMPYATLMYILENQLPVNEVIESRHTTRINMVVVETGKSRSGKWITFARNIADDYRRIYGEEPGHVRSIGILTDTDNTGEKTSAYYGDIKFSAFVPTKPLP
ncbi:MAG: DUF3047 domain-containing protein [Betaproteobacteria bacterium]